jgi:hypothetical protein
MRTAIISLLGLLSTPALCAGYSAQDTAMLFKKVCVNSPSEWIKLGEANASSGGWRLDGAQSGRKYGIVASETVKSSEAPLFDVRTWKTDISDGGTVSVWVVGPEWPMLKANSCTVNSAGLHSDELLLATAGILGYEVARTQTVFAGRGWVTENTQNKDVMRLQLIGVSQQDERDGTHSSVYRIDWDIPVGRSDLPHQGFAP